MANLGSLDINTVIVRLTNQLLDGCGHSDCTEELCYTGLLNTTPSTEPPVQRPTPMSARYQALALAAEPNIRDRLCRRPSQESSRNTGSPAKLRDDGSFAQLISDAPGVRAVCSGQRRVIVTDQVTIEATRLYKTLDPLFKQPTSLDHQDIPVISNTKAAKLILPCIKWLITSAPSMSHFEGVEHRDAYIEMTRRRAANTVRLGATSTIRRLIHDLHPELDCFPNLLLDDYENRPKLRLMTRVLEALALRTKLEHALDSLRHYPYPPGSFLVGGIVHMVKRFTLERAKEGGPIAATTIPLLCTSVVWAQKVFWKEWDLSPVVRRGSAVCGALEYLEFQFNFHRAFLSIEEQGLWDMITARNPLELPEGAMRWMQCEDDADCRHLLSFNFLCQSQRSDARAEHFRMINHLKMSSARSESKANRDVRLRESWVSHEFEPQGRLKKAEEVFLVLNVGREHLLRDAFDQVWQRRRNELFRPLRVRLGEAETLEIGQDLGGVQIEFFNLVCKEALDEENQMFAIDPNSGLAFFRPMSLQPLHMFERLGLLMGLAIYNGITLPISFPLVFYRELLDSNRCGKSKLAMKITSTKLMRVENTLEMIRDIWPDLYASLRYICQHGDLEDIGCSFPLEANGLRLEVSPMATPDTGPLNLMVINASADKHHEVKTNCVAESATITSAPQLSTTGKSAASVDIEAIAKDWPGWHLHMAGAPDVPEPVPLQSVGDYVRCYVRFLTHTSVAPQLSAFKRGLFTVLDLRALSLFDPESLRLHIEGETTVDIRELRYHTKYENGFTSEDEYIKTFWHMVMQWSPQRQMQLVKFVTAAERIPRLGPRSLRFCIHQNLYANPDDLPTSATCFGLLKLPVYPSREILEKKMILAVEYGCEGFGQA